MCDESSRKRQKRARDAITPDLPDDEAVDRRNTAQASIGQVIADFVDEKMIACLDPRLERLESRLHAHLDRMIERIENSREVDQVPASLENETTVLNEDGSLQTQMTTLKKQFAQKEKECEKKAAENGRLRKQIGDYFEENLAQQNKLTRAQGPDNDAVMSAYSSLFYAIQNMAAIDFKGEPFAKPSKKIQRDAFQKLTADSEDGSYAMFLTSVEHKCLIIEAVVWDQIIEGLLKTPLAAYTGNLFVESVARSSLKKNLGDFPAWRSGSADLFHDNLQECHHSWKAEGELRVNLVQNLFDILFKFRNAKVEGQLRSDLNNIVGKAVELARLMAKSRAFWAVNQMSLQPRATLLDYDLADTRRYHSFDVLKEFTNVKYYRERIQEDNDDEGDKRLNVDLVVRPMLIKWGDTSGQDYHVCHTMHRREVIASPYQSADQEELGSDED